MFQVHENPHDGLQLQRAIIIQPGGKRLPEKQAIAPSAARFCWTAHGLTYSALFMSQAVRGFSPLFALDL
jgi:hypothetical protein